MGFYLQIIWNKVLMHAKTRMNLENRMRANSQTPKNTHPVRFHSREMSRTSKPTERESQLVVPRADEEGYVGAEPFLYQVKVKWVGACQLINGRKVDLLFGDEESPYTVRGRGFYTTFTREFVD